MMNKKLTSVLLALLLLPIFASVVQGGTSWVRANQYGINQIKNGSGESRIVYDYGTWWPLDDVYLEGYAQSSGYNKVYVYIETAGGSDRKEGAKNGQTVHLVAAMPGQDHATYAYGQVISRAGNTYMYVYP